METKLNPRTCKKYISERYVLLVIYYKLFKQTNYYLKGELKQKLVKYV